MKLSKKLTLTFLATSLIPLIVVGMFSYIRTQNALDKQIRMQITSTTDRQAQKVETRLDQLEGRLNIFTNKLQIRLQVAEYNRSASAASQDVLNESLKNTQQEELGVRNIHLTNTDGKVIASTDSETVGKDFSSEEVFRLGSKQPIHELIHKDNRGDLLQYLAAPLDLEGRMVGVGIIERRLDDFLITTSDYSGLGNTGESYLLRKLPNGKYQYINPLRFAPQSALKDAPEGVNPQYDYRGKKVLIASKPVGDNWTLVTKIDAAEVNAPAIALGNGTMLIIAATVLAVSIAAWYLSRTIAGPLLHFMETVRRIRGGDLSERVRIESKDEVGMLANAFNDMTNDLVASQARLLASVLGLTQGFMIVEADGTIRTINDAAVSLLKLKEKPKTALEALGTIKNFECDKQFKLCMEQKKALNFKDLSHEGAFLYIYLSPITIDDKAIGVAIQIADVTEEKILQRSRDEFFSIASHELRTPLTAIRGNATMIQEFYGKKIDDADFSQMLEDIHGSSVRLIEIVNDFLDVSRLEQGKVHFEMETFDIDEILESVVYEMGVTAKEKKNVIKLEKTLGLSPPIYADKNRVKQIVYNLIGNGMKFTENGSLTLTKRVEGKQLKVSITDTGLGISDANQKLLFHKFQQASDSLLTRETSRGTGLGLYISKLLCENLGGKVALEHSELGIGSTFSFTIPIATKEQTKKSLASSSNVTSGNTP